jgi:hypothetical protein
MAEDVRERPPGRRAKDGVTARDLARIRAYRGSPPARATRSDYDLSTALSYLPEDVREQAEQMIRPALYSYRLKAPETQRPPGAALGRYFRSIEAHARELDRLLLAADDGTSSLVDAVAPILPEELGKAGRLNPPMQPEEFGWLRARLHRLMTAAAEAAERGEATKRAGRPTDDRLAGLISEMEPLWQAAWSREGFVEACLAAIGEGRGKDVVRKAIERFGRNGQE